MSRVKHQMWISTGIKVLCKDGKSRIIYTNDSNELRVKTMVLINGRRTYKYIGEKLILQQNNINIKKVKQAYLHKLNKSNRRNTMSREDHQGSLSKLMTLDDFVKYAKENQGDPEFSIEDVFQWATVEALYLTDSDK